MPSAPVLPARTASQEQQVVNSADDHRDATRASPDRPPRKPADGFARGHRHPSSPGQTRSSMGDHARAANVDHNARSSRMVDLSLTTKPLAVQAVRHNESTWGAGHLPNSLHPLPPPYAYPEYEGQQ